MLTLQLNYYVFLLFYTIQTIAYIVFFLCFVWFAAYRVFNFFLSIFRLPCFLYSRTLLFTSYHYLCFVFISYFVSSHFVHNLFYFSPIFQFRKYQLLPTMPPIVKPFTKQMFPIRVNLRLQPLHSVRILNGHSVFLNGLQLLLRSQCHVNQNPNPHIYLHTNT